MKTVSFGFLNDISVCGSKGKHGLDTMMLRVTFIQFLHD